VDDTVEVVQTRNQWLRPVDFPLTKPFTLGHSLFNGCPACVQIEWRALINASKKAGVPQSYFSLCGKGERFFWEQS
jgi:hypothetical protein